ncbi:MAG: putative porin [Prevotellaceae bacterium]|jgi:hypothetical protein|nr:putative porin [Prevotellaceae bacterium]
MKRKLLIFCLFGTFLAAFSQENVAKKNAASLSVWNISENLGTMQPAVPDTIETNFQNTSTDAPFGIANAWNGNLGSPMESKIYFDRRRESDFLFLKPYNPYYQSVEDYQFFNVKSPYSNIAYWRGGPSYGKEERFKTVFAVNVNPRLNFGFNFDYLYGRGIYLSQSSNDMLGGLFGSYTGKHYQAHGVFSINNFKNLENGGIKDERYITNPQQIQEGTDNFDPQNIETNLLVKNATSELKNRLAYYNHKYRIGSERVSKTDSTKTEFVPITSIIHTIKLESDKKYYSEQQADTLWYADTYDRAKTNDRADFFSVKNTVGIELNEEFNTLARFGMTAFAALDHQEYRYADFGTKNENNVSLGGILSKNLGVRLKYNIFGEYYLVGKRIANDFKLSGNLSYLFPIKNDTVKISANGFINSNSPDYFINHYQSNHFEWQTNFDKEYKTHIGGKIAVPTRYFELGVNVENITNYIYFDNGAKPAQNDGSVQILAANLKQDFVLWYFHLENQVVFQQSSKQEVLPLPAWAFYHNLYFKKQIFKVLDVQLGVDVHWHTKYFAPSYMPATGQFYVQNNEKIGNYPVVNIYGNFHLKQFRFFLMYYHANYNISEPAYFSMPAYPINRSMLKIGVSWNFYD